MPLPGLLPELLNIGYSIVSSRPGITIPYPDPTLFAAITPPPGWVVILPSLILSVPLYGLTPLSAVISAGNPTGRLILYSIRR